MIFLKCLEYLQRKMRADGKEITGTSHLSTLMGGRGHVEKWIAQKPPKPRLNLTLPPRGLLLQMLLASLALLPFFLAGVHPFMEVTTGPKHSKDGQLVEREDARGWGGCVITAPGSCLCCTVLVILFSGEGIWGGERAYDMEYFECGFGRDCDRCLTLPLKIAILIHLKGSSGTNQYFFWGCNLFPTLC